MALPLFPISRALGEFAIIVLGVLAAFAVENWRDDRNQQELESEYLMRLGTDIRSDVERLDLTLNLGRAKVDALKTISGWHPAEVVEPERMIRRLGQSTVLGWSLPSLNTSTIEDLESTGNLGVIRNVGVREAILEYYRELRDVRGRLERRMTRYPHHVYEIVPGDLLRTAMPMKEAVDVEFDRALYAPELQRVFEDLHTDSFQRDLRAEENYARALVDLLEAHRAHAETLLEKL